jgi:hypothetical protein
MLVTPMLHRGSIYNCQYKVVFTKFTDDCFFFRLSFSIRRKHCSSVCIRFKYVQLYFNWRGKLFTLASLHQIISIRLDSFPFG